MIYRPDDPEPYYTIPPILPSPYADFGYDDQGYRCTGDKAVYWDDDPDQSDLNLLYDEFGQTITPINLDSTLIIRRYCMACLWVAGLIGSLWVMLN